MGSQGQRNATIIQLREAGASLQEIGDCYGITRERVRQIVGSSVFKRECRTCGNRFQTSHVNKDLCGECLCLTCGKELTYAQASIGTLYCNVRCSPDYKGASGGGTFRSSGVMGIYRHYYMETELPINDIFYCVDLNTGSFIKFETMDQAKEYRASDVWRKRAKE
jgi:hypothetical protein